MVTRTAPVRRVYQGGMPRHQPRWPKGFRWPNCHVCGQRMHGEAHFDVNEVWLQAVCYPCAAHPHRIGVELPWPLPDGWLLDPAGARALGLQVVE